MNINMNRREFLGTLAALSQLPNITNAAAFTEGSSNRPNILFIMTDQLRYDCIGANGNDIIQTPNLDRLASQSANFTHAFVQSPVCTPSRACYFSGRYAHSHRNRVNYTLLDKSEKLLPAYLQQAGYKTASIGKLHLDYNYPPSADEAKNLGFDIVERHDGVSFTDEWSDYVKWRNQRDPLKDIYYRSTVRSVEKLRKNLPPDANPFRAVIDEQYTDTTWVRVRTRYWLEKLTKSRKPFFLFSSIWKPHGPFEVPVPYDSMYNDIQIPLPKKVTMEDIKRMPLPVQKHALLSNSKNPPDYFNYMMDLNRLQWIYRSYYGAVSHIDREVGLILDTLEQSGQKDNTIIIFCSDHGDLLNEHGIMGKNVFFESSINVPLMIYHPKKIQAGRYSELIETVDVLPTLFELIGLSEPLNCQGRSFAPLISNISKSYIPNEQVFSENIIPSVVTRHGYDCEFEKGTGVLGIRHPDAKMIRTDRWKYNYYPDYDGELYDLQNDPLENHNLFNDPKYKSICEDLKERILYWLITASETDQIAPKWLL
ncbi:sulfatase [candidate division KSB1 bacterium]